MALSIDDETRVIARATCHFQIISPIDLDWLCSPANPKVAGTISGLLYCRLLRILRNFGAAAWSSMHVDAVCVWRKRSVKK